MDYVSDLDTNAHTRHRPALLACNRNSVFHRNLFTRGAQALGASAPLPCLCSLPPGHEQTRSVPALNDMSTVSPSTPLPGREAPSGLL